MSEDSGGETVTNVEATTDSGNRPENASYGQRPLDIRLRRNLISRSAPAQDITSTFKHAASSLNTGELVKDEFFTLYEAVGALEIMDPKMDSGYLEEGEPLEDTYDTYRPITPEELIHIMDSLLSLQVAWMTGYPLSQTVFASVYVENILWPEPRTLEEATFRPQSLSTSLSLCQRVLRIYCLLVIKACDLIYRQIAEETYYEEEDFYTQLYNRPLLTAFPPEQILELAEKLRQTLEVGSFLSLPLQEALLSRLNVQRYLLEAIQYGVEGLSEIAIVPWQSLLDRLERLDGTHVLGKPVPGTISTKLQRKLASSVPPRPIVELEFAPTLDFLKRLCKDGILLGELSRCNDIAAVTTFVSFFQAQHPQPTTYMRCQLQRLIIHKFPHFEEVSPGVLANYSIFAEVKRLVYPEKALITAVEDDLGGPSNGIVQNPQSIAAGIRSFIGIVNKPLWSYIRALTMNRSRTRRMLCHIAVEWDAVQLELEDLDADMRRLTSEKPLPKHIEELWEYPLSSWAYDIKLRQLILIHQLGFELEVYHKEELSSTYWTLQWLCSTRHAHLQRIALFVNTRAQTPGKRTQAESTDILTTLATLQYHLDHMIAVSALAECLAVFYELLTRLNLLPKPTQTPYSTDSLRYALRTRPFQHILQPALPSAEQEAALRESFYEDIIQTARISKPTGAPQSLSQHHQDCLALLDHVNSIVRVARKAWDAVARTDIAIVSAEACESAWRADVKNTQKAAIAVGIITNGVRTWIEQGATEGELQIQVDMGHDAALYHVFWIVPKLKRPAPKESVQPVAKTVPGKNKGKA